MITLKAPAKINWSLYVLNKRDDGYHNILTLMQCIDLCDTLTFEHADTIELVSAMDIPPSDNLVMKAAQVLKEHAGVATGARITLTKEIPTGAGLGGGSSDAAAALKGLRRLWRLSLTGESLQEIGSTIGADVPFFFSSPIAVAEGKGELLTPLPAPVTSIPLLIVKPSFSIPTAWAYGQLRRQSDLTKSGSKMDNIKLIYEFLSEGSTALLGSLHNDFEEVVLREHPLIGEIKEKLMHAGARAALMSGSGSAVFGVFDDADQARAASEEHFSSQWNRVVATMAAVMDAV